MSCVWRTHNWEEQSECCRAGLLVMGTRTGWRNILTGVTGHSTGAGARPCIWGGIMMGKHNSCGLSSSEAAQKKTIRPGYACQASSYCVHRNGAGTMIALSVWCRCCDSPFGFPGPTGFPLHGMWVWARIPNLSLWSVSGDHSSPPLGLSLLSNTSGGWSGCGQGKQ